MLIAAANTVVAVPTGAVKAAAGKLPAASATLSPQVLQQLQSFQFASKTPAQLNYPWLTHTIAGSFLVLAVSLVLLLAVQTTKQEGLSGTIGGRVESAYRPRLGFDQQLARLTSFVAIGMVFCAFLLSITGI
jgi:protein translocase SecG subunit